MWTRPLRIVVASADGDMAGLLNQHVAWLALVQRPSPSRPAPWRLQTAASFQREHGLPTHALSDFRALTGASLRRAHVRVDEPAVCERTHGRRTVSAEASVMVTAHDDLVPVNTQASLTLG
jgi:hypothetical protein